MKKKLSKDRYRFILKEFNEHRDRGIITKEQVDDMMTFYEEESSMNFIKILVTIGAILVGLGVLSFVSSNWMYINKPFKVGIIILALGLSIFASFKLEKVYPKTSKALLYLSVLIYGAGIFLIEQIFHFGGEFTRSFLLWTIGAIPIGLLLKEKIIFIFTHILFMVYINGSFDNNIIVYSVIILAILYAGNKYFNFSKIVTFFNNLVGLNFLLYFLNYIDMKAIYVILIFFGIGLAMYYTKHSLNLEVFKFEGLVTLGISGLFLTSKHAWQELNFISNGNAIAITCGILLLVYLLTLVKKGMLTPLIFVCALILRYYFDTLYDFMPKSIFFIVGGAILLGFGYYFERLRKNLGGALDEKNN